MQQGTNPTNPGTSETMTVTVRDRESEAPWGSQGWITPYIRQVTISAYCQQCGQRRGTPRPMDQCDDGAYYSVDVWTNPCGHLDRYPAVIAEARELSAAGGA